MYEGLLREKPIQKKQYDQHPCKQGQYRDYTGNMDLHDAKISMITSTSGDTNSTLSKRSSTPPWPGRSAPESFTLALRFNNDSARSPMVPNIAMTSAMANQCHVSSSGENIERI